MTLKTNLNATAPDEIYEALIKMHEGLSDEDSQLVNAKLILVLANHIGDTDIIAQATKIARGDR